MSTAVTNLPEQIQQVMAGTPYWTRVRRARFLLAEKLGRRINPNAEVSDSEPWIYITAIDDGDVFLEGVRQIAIRTFESSVENAARKIAEKSHRLSTEEEIESFKVERKEREAFCAIEDERVNPQKAAQRAQMVSSAAIAKAVEAMSENTRATREVATGKRVSQEEESDPGISDKKIQRRG